MNAQQLTGMVSMFLIYEDGHWEQPSVRLSRPATEQEIERAAMAHYGRRVIFVDRIAEDPDAEDLDDIDFETLNIP